MQKKLIQPSIANWIILHGNQHLRFDKKLEAEKVAVRGPISDLITLELSYKRVKKDIQKAWKKEEKHDDDGDDDAPSAPTKPRKRKAKAQEPPQEEDAAEATEPKPKGAKSTKRRGGKWWSLFLWIYVAQLGQLTPLIWP